MSVKISSLTPGILVETRAARVSVLPERGRLSLRARGDLKALNTAFGLPLPDIIGRRAKNAEAEAVRLGPDEWIILSSPEQMAKLLNDGKTDLLPGFISRRTRRPFKAFLVKGKDGKISFEFEERKAKAPAKGKAAAADEGAEEKAAPAKKAAAAVKKPAAKKAAAKKPAAKKAAPKKAVATAE